ncbi:MAG: hypothetical protein ACK57V_08590 [Pirellula sp.]
MSASSMIREGDKSSDGRHVSSRARNTNLRSFHRTVRHSNFSTSNDGRWGGD